jgi:hypothetical protein
MDDSFVSNADKIQLIDIVLDRVSHWQAEGSGSDLAYKGLSEFLLSAIKQWSHLTTTR